MFVYLFEGLSVFSKDHGRSIWIIANDNKEARQTVAIKKGVDTDLARKIVKMIKGSKLKVQAAIQGEQVRITGKKRDDLQDTIAAIKEAKFEIPLQYINFRD